MSQSQPSVFFPSDQRPASMRTPPSSAAATPPRVRPEPKDTHAQGSPPAVLSRPVSYRVCVVRRASYVVCVEGTASQVSAAMQCLQEEEEK